ncbi:uncharacterized protein BDW70DRAFT_766 [Aspergillus foveolatus]|uniref:uncharacterized protein n=1 Tax=Aspergillus foveolatus TaxID=210207 RepID=UPI003CCDA44A
MMLHEISLVFIYFAPFVHVFLFFGSLSSYLPFIWNEPGSGSGSTVFDHIFIQRYHLLTSNHLYYYHHLDPNPFLSALALGPDVCGHSCIPLLFILGDMLKCC